MNILKNSFTRVRQEKTVLPYLTGALVLFCVSLLVGFYFGAVKIPLSEIFGIIMGRGDEGFTRIFLLARLPRVCAAALSGAALAVSGVILQSVLDNPMCAPNIIGANAGAGLFVILLAGLLPKFAVLTPIVAFFGSLFALAAVYFISRGGASRLTVVLSGVAISGLFTAVIDGVVTLMPELKASRVDFMIGSFSGVTMANVMFAAPYVIIGIAVVVLLGVDLNVLSLGDETASSLGMNVKLTRGIFLVIAAALAGSAISLAGLIGFVGLIIPHIAKILIGHNYKSLPLLCALLGAAFTLLCDTFARSAFAPFEVPVGIILSVIGSPFFIYLILTRKRRGGLD